MKTLLATEDAYPDSALKESEDQTMNDYADAYLVADTVAAESSD